MVEVVELARCTVARPLHREAAELVLQMSHQRNPLRARGHAPMHQHQGRPLAGLEHLAAHPGGQHLVPAGIFEMLAGVPVTQLDQLPRHRCLQPLMADEDYENVPHLGAMQLVRTRSSVARWEGSEPPTA